MSRFKSVAKICRRWQRRYKRKGFGRPLGKQRRTRGGRWMFEKKETAQ
jgi:hypothetical protein